MEREKREGRRREAKGREVGTGPPISYGRPCPEVLSLKLTLEKVGQLNRNNVSK